MMQKRLLHKIWDIFSYVLATVFVLGGTLFAYYYANGYRLNPINGEVTQTGVLSVETIPSRSEIFVNGQNIGKSPKVSSIDVGNVPVKIQREGYITWEKTIPIMAEKSTALTPTLFLENPQAESVYSATGKVLQQILDPNGEAIYALIQTEKEYRLIKYDTNKRFWNLSDNPQIPYKTDIKDIKSINIDLSKDGRWALITKTSEAKKKTYEFAKLTLPFQTIEETDLADFASDYSVKWSNDSNYLTLESTGDIIAYRVTDGTKYLLLRKNNKTKYIWNTDSEGFFYYTSLEKADGVNRFSLIQTTLQGSNKKTILKDVYFQTSDAKVNEIKNNQTLTFDAQTNTKENDIFSGELTSFTVIPNTNGLLLVTTKATYWYNQEENTYLLVHASPSEFISVSPDRNKLIFFDKAINTYFSFTFEKIEADPLTVLGTLQILQGENITDLRWQNNSQDISYRQGEELRIVEYDGTNNHKAVPYNGAFGFSSDLQYLYTISIPKEAGSLEVLRYKMY